MRLHLLLPTKWKTLDSRITRLSDYLATSSRLGGIYGKVDITYDIVKLPELTLNAHGVYNKKDILAITSKYHDKADAVGIVFPFKQGEKYAGNYYPNEKGEVKMDFYIKASENTREGSGYAFEEFIEHEMAHAVALDLGLSGQYTSTGYRMGADNTHYYFYNNKKDLYYKEINEQWKKKFGILSQMLTSMSQILANLLGQKKNEVTDLLPEVKEKMEKLIKICDLMDMPIRVTSGFRSFAEQDKLYAQGRTTAGKIVTNAKGGESDHNFGKAFDIVFRRTGYEGNWELVGQIGEQIGLKWGGRWTSFQDRPHFYI